MGSSSHYLFFTAADGNLLIRILIPLIIGMVLSNRLLKVLEGKLLLPVLKGLIVFLLTIAISGEPMASLLLGAAYLMALLGTHLACKRWASHKPILDILGTGLLPVVALLGWSLLVPGFQRIWVAGSGMILDYKLSLVVLGYLVMLWPASSVVKACLNGIARTVPNTTPPSPVEPDAERGGRMIGMFERVIIFTLVLLGEYSAIGFLITGKSIIRFAQSNEKIRSEYVLLGTMVSYTVAIVSGVWVNWLLKIG